MADLFHVCGVPMDSPSDTRRTISNMNSHDAVPDDVDNLEDLGPADHDALLFQLTDGRCLSDVNGQVVSSKALNAWVPQPSPCCAAAALGTNNIMVIELFTRRIHEVIVDEQPAR